MQYEPVIGLEIHCELDTRSKLFCGCSTAFGSEPNSQVCPVCLGMPGVLPVMNRVAFEYALKMAIALDCTVPDRTVFDRKNYYYPDLPKNYQISQLHKNLGDNGTVDIIVDGEIKKVGIWNVHLEEDAGKLTHSESASDSYSLVDLNRTGQPLLEIVSAPDMRSAAEAESYMRTLRAILLYTEVSDCKMEEGKLRFEPSISIRPIGSEEFGVRVEVKNIGSISAAVKAVEYEIARQTKAWESGEELVQETRLWNEQRDRTETMRRKETSADYRYFPEPDLVDVEIDEYWKERVYSTIPELPVAKRLRFQDKLKLSDYDAAVLADDHRLAKYFEDAVGSADASPKAVANWVINDVLRIVNEQETTIDAFACPARRIGALAAMTEKGDLNSNMAREVFADMIEKDEEPEAIVEAKGLKQISDSSELEQIVDEVIAGSPDIVASYKAGKTSAANALIGPIMKATKGKANPKMVREIMQQRLEAL
jgi:aspartyl-tRNA(Asn)/glutamyl-tRNA(Gln) amidotransferase subunit B